MAGEFEGDRVLGTPAVTLFNDRFLNRDFLVGYLNEYVGIELPFIGMVPRFETNSQTITGYKEKYGLLENPELSKMRPLVPGTSFKNIHITALDTIKAAVKGRGFKIDIMDEARIYQEGLDDISRAIQAVAAFAVKDINDEMVTALKADVRQETSGDKFYDFVHSTGHLAWTDDDCMNYIKDLSRLKRTVRYLEKRYQIDQVFVNTDDFGAFTEFLAELNISQDAKRSMFWAELNMAVPNITVGTLGIRVNEVQSGLDTGKILGLDSANPPMSMYYTRNPLYPQAFDNLPTPVKPLGLHVYTKDDRDNGVFTIKVWFENAFLVKTPDSGYSGSLTA